MGKFTDAVLASGKKVSDEARSLLEHFESIIMDISAEEKRGTESLFNEVKGLVEVNSKDLGEHKETLLAVAAKVDRQVEGVIRNGADRFMDAVKAKTEEIKALANGNGGKVSLTIKAAAGDPVATDPNYPEGLPVPQLDSTIGRIPMPMGTLLDDADVATYGQQARPITFIDETPYEGDANWWEKGLKKDQVSWGYVSSTALVKTIAVITRAYKYDLVDLEFLRQDIYRKLTVLLRRKVTRDLLLGVTPSNPAAPTGLTSVAVAYNNPTASGTVKFANIADAISAMTSQIRTAGYEGQIIARISPAAYALLTSSKDENGNYLDYSRALAGIVVREDPGMTGMTALVGIFENYHVRLFGDITIDIIVGSILDGDGVVVGTDHEFNIVTFRAEQRLAEYVRQNERPSFVTGDLDAIIDDISAA